MSSWSELYTRCYLCVTFTDTIIVCHEMLSSKRRCYGTVWRSNMPCVQRLNLRAVTFMLFGAM